MRKILLVVITLFQYLTISYPPREALAISIESPNLSTPSELIEAVNNIRATYGVQAYNPNSILMNNAQKQAEYNLSISTITHISADGLRPFQRALQAGYAVAGDISNSSPGYFAENIVAGVGLTAEEAVKIWTEDDPHLNTMVSSVFQDIGAGVAFSGNTFYYVIDCGLSTGGTPAAFTPPPSYKPPIATMVPNTPNADGSISYSVQSGDTLLGIAIAYNISLYKLLSLNGLTAKSLIYAGQKIIIQAGYTPTPTMPTQTPTGLPTITSWPTSTFTVTRTPFPPTATPSASLPVSNARNTVIIIVGAALFLSALFVLAGFKRK
jgi:uncharacterized protein YkwD